MFTEQRADPREPLELPLKIGGGPPAVTRDISASGMYLEISGWHELDGWVVFEMHLANSGFKFTAEGLVVRVEHSEGKTGIAVPANPWWLETRWPNWKIRSPRW